MNQEAINSAWVAMAKLTEKMANSLLPEVDRLEDTGENKDFKIAQEVKVTYNKLMTQSLEMRTKYPHLFK